MQATIYTEIENLLDFAEQHLLLNPRDRLVARGRLYLFLRLEGLEAQATQASTDVYSLTAGLLRWAAEQQLYEAQSVTEMDLFLGNLLGQLTPLASQLEQRFWELYHCHGPEFATEFFYQISQDAAYIRNDRLAQNFSWHSRSGFTELEITINLSKPEKDPRVIAAAAQNGQEGKGSYPLCVLCMENEGYPGHLSWAPRCNHRVVELQLDGKDFAFQYSPYLYYPEHSILLSKEHKPMAINRETFAELFDFVGQFPHYMVGSNADLPIVGGSILSHHHFQAGRYEFPIFRAPVLFSIGKIEGVTVEVLQWPLSCIKLSGTEAQPLLDLGAQILDFWRSYSDENIGVLAQTEAAHNTITPIVRQNHGQNHGQNLGLYEFFLVLRNNRCNEQHPLGIFHPHAEIHHIKKENIGLIEVMGLAILPGRLKQEIQLMVSYLLSAKEKQRPTEARLQQHLPWLNKLKGVPSEAQELQNFLHGEIAEVFAEGLRHCAVLPHRASWQRFFTSGGFLDPL